MKTNGRKNKVIFLDRDGVINRFPGFGNYVTKVKDFRFVPGALAAIRRMTEAGYTLFVISNQAGVGKGIYSKEKLNRITRFMLKEVAQHKGKIKKVFYCTHRSDYGCGCRKPEIGSIKKALQSLRQNLHHAREAFFIGDTDLDMLAGHNAGCRTIFVLSGKENRRSAARWKVKPDFIARDLKEACEIIIHENFDHSRLRRRWTHQSRRSAF